ncbi:MAG TPA: O-antigen ligase family protein [Tepidisphaeraceae bacterium]|nr:O-antigen ligase family protein [Tepidisphaeraceae bacterium]
MPFAVAMLLTFGRTGFLPIIEVYTPFDYAVNVFVVLIAPVFAIIGFAGVLSGRYLKVVAPVGLLAAWVAIRVFASRREYWPHYSMIITILLALLLASQITQWELRRLRHCMLVVSALFCVFLLVFGRELLFDITAGWTKRRRVGMEVSAGNVIAYPRVLYMLVFTCFATVLIEKRKWLKLAAIGMMIPPTIVGLSTGGRGALLALVVAILAFVLGLRQKLMYLAALPVVAVFGTVGVKLARTFAPLMVERITSADDSGRLGLYREALSDISLFGRGPSAYYAHNIFLEFLQDYGVVGLLLFCAALVTTVGCLWRLYSRTRDLEVLWAGGLLVLQMVAQQLSLNIFYGFFWAAFVLPLGLAARPVFWRESPNELVDADESFERMSSEQLVRQV